MKFQWRYILKLLSGPVLGLTVAYTVDFGDNVIASRMALIATWMAAWWILETIHIAVTALLPLILFPLLGIMSMEEVAPTYMNQVIFLFIGGFMIAIAMEKWELHRRLALKILTQIGSSPNRILLAFMITCYFLSMWISNTATVMMLFPAVIAVIDQVEQQQQKKASSLAIGLLLGVAYAGSIGGTATLVGSPPNLIFQHFYNTEFEGGMINFSSWFAFGLPVSLLFFVITYGLLRYWFTNSIKKENLSLQVIQEKYNTLGAVRFEEKVISIVFGTTAILWFTRTNLNLGVLKIPGWSHLFEHPEYFHDSTVAMVMAGVLFIFPTRHNQKGRILEWKDMRNLPLGIILLFGGGFALAKGVETSGLTKWLAQQLSVLKGNHFILIILGLCTFMTFTTELTSNTASTQLVMPVLIALSASIAIHPIYIMLPVTFSASYAFMMPVATPPNTIIFGSDRINIPIMARTGMYLNLIGIVLLTLAIATYGSWLFNL